MAVTPIVTFFLVIPNETTAIETGSGVVFTAIVRKGLSRDFDPNSLTRYVLMAWLAGVALCSVRALGGWLFALRQLSMGRKVASDALRGAVARIAPLLGVSRRIGVFESTRALVPIVFGALRPVLIVPSSAVLGLPAAQLEAILAHEFAHIARHDFLVNCLQILVETVLFYHPAVWWLSKKIRDDRELCCDEMAIEVCGDRLMYSRALLQLEESRQQFALAASGGNLKARIERLLQPRMRKDVANGQVLPLLILLVTLGVTSWPGQRAVAMQALSPVSTDEHIRAEKLMAEEKARAEHERRKQYAEERFGLNTARAEIYMKFGPPAEIESHPSPKRDMWKYADGRIFIFEGDNYELMRVQNDSQPEFPAGTGQRIRLGGNLMHTKKLYAPPPLYPAQAKADHVQGSVRLAVLVGGDGFVKDTYIMSGGPSGLGPAAEEAVRRWTYQPTLLNGQPVEVVTTVDVNFTLVP